MESKSGMDVGKGGGPVALRSAEALAVTNWGRDIPLRPSVVVRPRTVEEIVAVVKDTDTYPSPVRAVGSRHSTTPCATADGGTIVDMSGMNRILDIGSDTVTAQAGARHLEVAKELRKHDLQFYVNVEIGSLTLGSGCCCGTKDASMPGEYGQVASYASSIKLVTPAGELREVTEDEPELMQAVRASHGLMGIVYEVTFKVQPLQAMSLSHETYTLDEFERALPGLVAENQSVMMYIFPFLGKVAVELRRYSGREAEAAKRAHVLPWKIRNFAWKTAVPAIGYLAVKFIPNTKARYFLIDWLNRMNQRVLHYLVRNSHTVPTDQIITYPEESDWTRYTFSIQAFDEKRYAQVLREYFDWIRQYYRDTGYRSNMIHVGYRIEKDQQSLFSYSWDGNVLTIDPVSTGDEGWEEFLQAYNEWCSQHGGVPLLNQTKWIERHQFHKAFGERAATFERYRKEFDPDDRLLSKYFADLVAAE